MKTTSVAFLLVFVLAAGWLGSRVVRADEPAVPEQRDPSPPLDQQTLFKQFEETMSGAVLVGRFTILGKEGDKLPEEEYTILRVTKLDKGDYWLFSATIKYGKNDYTVPLPLEVKWAGDTPMITLTDFTILGQGPFSARVLIYKDKYAGTWSHGQVGGHLFGRVVKPTKEPAPDATE